jgi:hypothetical protein
MSIADELKAVTEPLHVGGIDVQVKTAEPK